MSIFIATRTQPPPTTPSAASTGSAGSAAPSDNLRRLLLITSCDLVQRRRRIEVDLIIGKAVALVVPGQCAAAFDNFLHVRTQRGEIERCLPAPFTYKVVF